MENVSETVNKAMDILELFLLKDGEFSLAELSALSGFNKATAYRLSSTLVKRGILSQREKNGKYSLGLKMLDFSYAIRRNIKFIELAYLYLSRMSRDLNVSAYISVLDADSSLVIEEVAVVDTMRINSPIGKRLPLHATACGKVLLSSLSRDERRAYYGRNLLQPFTHRTVTDVSALEKEIENVKIKGIAVGEEDYKIGLYAIAAPLQNGSGTTIAAAGVVVPLSHAKAQIRQKLAIELKGCTAQISQVIGRIT
jgi:DNA-binding IclR family transcriptional regulator